MFLDESVRNSEGSKISKGRAIKLINIPSDDKVMAYINTKDEG